MNRLEPNGEGNCKDVHGVVSTVTNGDSSPAMALEQGCGSRDSVFLLVERCRVPEAQNTWLLLHQGSLCWNHLMVSCASWLNRLASLPRINVEAMSEI